MNFNVKSSFLSFLSMYILLCIFILLPSSLSYPSIHKLKLNLLEEFQFLDSTQTLNDPYVDINMSEMNNIKDNGPGSSYSLVNIKPANIAIYSGYFTLLQKDSVTYAVKRDFESDIVYADLKGLFGKMEQELKVGKESDFTYYPTDTSISKFMMPIQSNSIIRFEGIFSIAGYTFIGEGTGAEKLTFTLVDNYGLVYLRGKGKIEFNDGKVVSFGR